MHKLTYYLKDLDDGRIIARIEINNYDYHAVIGDCYEYTGWLCDENHTTCEELYFTGFYCKWDGCTHWYFYGEDFDTERPDNVDAYYHICGKGSFLKHVRLMCFVWEVSRIVMCELGKQVGMDSTILENYRGNERLVGLLDSMLAGYEIAKVVEEKNV